MTTHKTELKAVTKLIKDMASRFTLDELLKNEELIDLIECYFTGECAREVLEDAVSCK
jgi:hypothetical protein